MTTPRQIIHWTQDEHSQRVHVVFDDDSQVSILSVEDDAGDPWLEVNDAGDIDRRRFTAPRVPHHAGDMIATCKQWYGWQTLSHLPAREGHPASRYIGEDA